MNIEKINFLIKNYFNYECFRKIKKNIKKINNEIRLENIDTTKLINTDKLNKYLKQLIEKNPTCSLVFNNSKINNLSIITNQLVSFNSYNIYNLKINGKISSRVNFNKSIFNFNEDNIKIIINTSKVNCENCTVNITNNRENKLEFGADSTSVINIKNQNFINENNNYFKIIINSKSLYLSKYKSDNNVEIIVNDDKRKIDYIHLVNSEVNFNSKNIIDANMLLVDNSDVKGMIIKSESIEISGSSCLDNTKILKCNDISLNEDTALTTKNIVLYTKYLESAENSEINDTTNRFKWLTNIDEINVGKDFKLKYNNKTIYSKQTSFPNSDVEQREIVEIINKERKKR